MRRAQCRCGNDGVSMSLRKFGDIRLYYESSGQGEPVLLIHGLGSSTRDWEYQVPAFTKDYRVLVPDLRGHGKSDKPPGPYSMPLFARDIAALIRSQDIPPVHVIGLSLGGFVAFQLAVDHPELVRSLVVVNSAAGMPRDKFRDRLLVARSILLRRLIVRLFGMRALGRFLGGKLFQRPDQMDLKRTFIERCAENQRNAYLASLASISGWGIEDQLGSISCRTCVISGEHDFIPFTLKESYTAKLPNAELIVIPGSGHFTPVDDPVQFNQVVMSFLAKQISVRQA